MAESLVAQPFVTFVVKRLGELLIQEARFLGGVRAQVQQLQTELNRMQCFLKAADAKGDDIVRTWVAEIREIAYDAEDVIVTFVVKVAPRTSTSGQFPFILKRYLCIFKERGALRKVGLEIEVINTKINSLTRSLQTYGIQSSTGRVGGGGGGGESSSISRFERQQQLRRSYPHIVEEDVVRIEDDVKAVVDLLVDENKKHLRVRVVSIWGMGGLGKTTLAKRVYNHNKIRRHFDCYAWAYISQQCNPREVLEEILIKLVSPLLKERKEIKELKLDELVEKLYKVQSEKKCLVILDDIWKDEDWDSLIPAFPTTKKVAGSKILLTTRNREVAKHIDQQCCIYELKHLTQEESWELFEKKISLRREEITAFILSTKMIELGKEMVRHCGGLPLAIVVLGGLLATKHQLDEWETMSRNICHNLGKGKGQEGVPVTDILALSYQDLPYHLKACFLYLGHLPEDHDIPTKKLVQMWIAEGIVFSPLSTQTKETSEEETILDVGMSYLGELVQRCMVQVQLTRFSKRIKLCRLHDLMRDLCLLKAQEENFLKVVRIEYSGNQLVWADTVSSSSSSSLTTIRRLVVYHLGDRDATGTKNEYANRLCGNEMKNHHHIRSCQFYFFGNYVDISDWKKLKLLFKGLTLLTILDLERITFGGGFKKLPRAIGNLIQLRYLSVRRSMFDGLPFSIGNLGFLQTLDLRAQSTVRIPNVLWKLEQLRYLYLPFAFELPCIGKLRLDGLKKLKMLEGFNTEYCDVRCFPKLTTLRKVGVVRVAPKDLVAILKSPIFSNNNNNSNHHHHLLQSSSFRIEGNFQTEEEGRLLRQFLGCDRVHKLYIVGSLNLVKLPDQLFPPNLTRLTLEKSGLVEDPMPTLEKLPNLRRLSLREESYIGKEMVCSAPTTPTVPSNSVGGGYGCDGGFPQLKYLVLWNIENLEEWRVEEGAMPTLFRLEIHRCGKLKEISDGLRFITTLRELEFRNVSKALKDRVREGGEDFYKIQHSSIKIKNF